MSRIRELSVRTASYCVWHRGVARTCIRSDHPLAARVASMQGVPHHPSCTEAMIDVGGLDGFPDAVPTSQVQIMLRGGAMICNTEWAVERDGVYVVARTNHVMRAVVTVTATARFFFLGLHETRTCRVVAGRVSVLAAGRYTMCHSLSPRDESRIVRLAGRPGGH